MHFYLLIYFNNRSSTCFEHSNYPSLIKPVYHDARYTDFVQKAETFLSNSTHLYSSNKMLCQTQGFPFVLWQYFKFVGVLTQSVPRTTRRTPSKQ